ncbi:hypothetical protein [Nocardia sp. NBC_00511]|uniref:hypothetical protein n=1 Tax=Nocardia sp. NBC_00511 TaxID=2903591 RepID=UPI0030E2D903
MPGTPSRVQDDIFKRIDTGGEPLNAMEIRHCMSSARSRDLLKLCVATEAFQVATAGVLRFLAFRSVPGLQQYEADWTLESLLDATTELIDDPDRLSDAQIEGLCETKSLGGSQCDGVNSAVVASAEGLPHPSAAAQLVTAAHPAGLRFCTSAARPPLSLLDSERRFAVVHR